MLNLTYQNDFFDFTSYQNTRQQMYKPLDISEESIYQGPFLEKGKHCVLQELGTSPAMFFVTKTGTGIFSQTCSFLNPNPVFFVCKPNQSISTAKSQHDLKIEPKETTFQHNEI